MPALTAEAWERMREHILNGDLRLDEVPWFIGVDYGAGQSYTVYDEVGPVPTSWFDAGAPALDLVKVNGVWQRR